MTRISICVLLLLAATARAQDAVVLSADADLRHGGGASALWIHPRGPTTLTAGLTFFSLSETRWAYGTAGGMLRANERTIVNAEANLGRGDDARGGFRYVLVRGGVTQELLAKRLWGEAEWLQVDVARRQNGIARVGATYRVLPPLTLRGSVYRSLAGDDDTTLATMRGDYDLGSMTAIAGFSAGRATPVLLQQSGTDETRVREAFGGVAVRGWTIIAIVGEDRQRLSVSWRIPMGER
ncbi:MAG TPA: hypothetical protein VND45_04965 [Thermoanaerobaculia bacterium]|jgi:hypothetical protein|nr:hypothetical protein [Thermoanaerobaculia bacterium]